MIRNDAKDERALKQGEELVAELFKLLDRWDREERRHKRSVEIAEIGAGASFKGQKKVN